MQNESLIIARVLLPRALNEPYDYLVPPELKPQVGAFVEVPLGRKITVGVVWNIASKTVVPVEKLKAISAILPLPRLPDASKAFVDKVAEYSLSPPGMVLKMALSSFSATTSPSSSPAAQQGESQSISQAITLNADQQESYQIIREKLTDKFSVTLIDGVTGSGKTEVYLKLVEDVIRSNGQALVLLPEISLSSQWVERFIRRFGYKPTIWHSSLTPKQRKENWRLISNGEARVIVGARSALFLPYPALRLIVVDEEHDQSYKQEEGVCYQARDMAVLRGAVGEIPIILASATPSLETWENVKSGKYSRVIMQVRHNAAQLPEIAVIDMRASELKSGLWLSDSLKSHMQQNLAEGMQTLLYLNRRGFAPLVLCRNCGYRFTSPDGSNYLVYHKKKNRMICHHTGFMREIPESCPECEQENGFAFSGPGVERLEEEVAKLFPEARIGIMASDSSSTPKQINELIRKIEQSEIDVLIGTQMVIKGHHFPRLTLVGVVDADLGLMGGDLRAGERTFQMLYQVSGRAGREQYKGKVLVQTYYPDTPAIQAIARGDRDAFLNSEYEMRKDAVMPPFCRLAAIIISSAKDERAKTYASALVRSCPLNDKIMIMGPAPAAIHYSRGIYRYRMLLKAPRNVNIQKFLSQWLSNNAPPNDVKLRLDIDPYSFA